MTPRTRERLADAAVVVLALAVTAGVVRAAGQGLVFFPALSRGAAPPWPWTAARDYLGGPAATAACLLLALRRSHPVAVAAGTTVAAAFAPAVGAACAALFTLAELRPGRVAAGVALLALPPLAFAAAVRPAAGPAGASSALVGAFLVAGATGAGAFVRTLRERSEQARASAGLRAERARREAREEIAREMHDVLAHRLSLLSVHAGALEYRPDARPQEVAAAAGVIRQSAHRALEDLHGILRVLRAPREEDAAPTPAPPQPRLGDVGRLVAESRAAGMDVRLEWRVTGAERASEVLGRTVYRVVQEGLTNARKHAPGREVRVTAAGEPGGELTVEISNAVGGTGGAGRIPGAGQGLAGLAERAALAGGGLRGGTAEGVHTLRLWLPWPS